MSADYSLSTKVMEIIYFIIGLLCIYCGVKNLKDKENPEPMGTFIFWAVLGGVQDASGHYDLVTHAPCIYVDNRMIMDHGQLTVLEPSIYI